jgi:putative FmdB family regulatory protein
MPIYEYRCERGHTFEKLQRMTDEPLEACETCEAPAARVLHAPAVHFKGSGFYNTDYGTRKRARESAESKKGDGGGEAKGGTPSSSESKPESKPGGGAKKAEAAAA